MKAYLLSLLAAAFLSAAVGILSPDGGIGKHVRLASALLVLCLLASPLPRFIESLRSFSLTDALSLGKSASDPFAERSEEALDAASRAYFVRMLSQKIAGEFSLPADSIECAVRWAEDGSPETVTVLLSGKAVWADPRKLETYVSDLLGCPCTTAIA